MSDANVAALPVAEPRGGSRAILYGAIASSLYPCWT